MEENNVIKLNTLIDPENTKLRFENFKPKSILQKRMLSFAVDIAVIGFIKFIVTISYASFIKTFFYQLDFNTQISLVKGIDMFGGFSSLLIFSSYFTFSHYLGQGKTIGKLLTKTTVVSREFIQEIEKAHFELSLRQSLLRMIGYFSAYLTLGIPFVSAFIRKDQRSWPDFISRSITLDDDDIYQLISMKSQTEETVEIDIETLTAA